MKTVAHAIPAEIVTENVKRLQSLMQAADVAAVIVFDAANMLAFTGTPHASWDRLTCAAVTAEGGTHLVCPAFERPGIAGAEPHCYVHVWQEDEDPYEKLAVALGQAGVRSGRVGVDGRMWLDVVHRFERALAGLAVCSGEDLLREVRICKSPRAIDLLKAAHARGERVFLELRQMVRPGVSELELVEALRAKFAGEADFAIGPMVQSGPNGAIPHNPTGTRKLQPGDNIVVDSVTITDGFFNDLTRTYAVGAPQPQAKLAYAVVRAAQQAAIAAARPGMTCGALDAVARDVIVQAGFGEYFTHRLGHGMGIECHEPPYLCAGNDEVLRPGMCVTIEPGVYVPGQFGVRIEDDVLITEGGCEVIAGDLMTDVCPEFLA